MNDKQRALLESIGYEDHLAHYGVPGMKWGVRKAPQPGKKTLRQRLKEQSVLRKKKKAQEAAEKAKIQKERKNVKETYKLNRSKIKKLTDEQLNERLTRLQNEKRLRELVESEVRPGRTAVTKALKASAIGVLGTLATGAFTYALKTASKGFTQTDGKVSYSMKDAAKAFNIVNMMEEIFKSKK